VFKIKISMVVVSSRSMISTNMDDGFAVYSLITNFLVEVMFQLSREYESIMKSANKIKFKCPKSERKYRMYLPTLYVHSQVFGKREHLCDLCKK
jgi:hypothetical protein